MASPRSLDKAAMPMSDPIALAALEGRISECNGWERSRGIESETRLCRGFDHQDFCNEITRYGDENRMARIHGDQRDDSARASDWSSVLQHRISSPLLLPAALFTPVRSDLSSAPPPIPPKSPERIKPLLKLIFEHVDAEEILRCIHARLLPWSALRDSEAAARKLWLIAVEEPIEAQHHLPAAAVGPEGAPKLYLNPLIYSLKAFGGSENLPFDSTSYKYEQAAGKWLLKIRCSETALGLRNKKSWGEMRLAFASAGAYYAQVSVYSREPSETGTSLERDIVCTNATKVKELMIWIIVSLTKQQKKNHNADRQFPLASTVSRSEARWLEETLKGDATFRQLVASGYVSNDTSAAIGNTWYLTRKSKRSTKVHRSRLPIGVRSNLRHKRMA